MSLESYYSGYVYNQKSDDKSIHTVYVYVIEPIIKNDNIIYPKTYQLMLKEDNVVICFIYLVKDKTKLEDVKSIVDRTDIIRKISTVVYYVDNLIDVIQVLELKIIKLYINADINYYTSNVYECLILLNKMKDGSMIRNVSKVYYIGGDKMMIQRYLRSIIGKKVIQDIDDTKINKILSKHKIPLEIKSIKDYITMFVQKKNSRLRIIISLDSETGEYKERREYY